MSIVFLFIAILLFLLAGFGADAFGLAPIELTYFGLAFFAAGVLLGGAALGPIVARVRQ